MVIELDLVSVRRFWSKLDGEVRFVLDVDFGPFEPSYQGLAEIGAEVRQRLDRTSPGNAATATEWVHTDKGWAGVLVGVPGVDDLVEWFELFNARWSDAVHGRVLGGPRGGSTAWGPGDASQMSAFVAYETGDLTLIDSDYRTALWYVDPTLTRYLADQAIVWAYRRGDKHSFVREGWAVRPADLDYGQALADGLERCAGASVEFVRARPFRGRQAAFTTQGLAKYAIVDPDSVWDDQLADIRRVLTWSSPRTDLGLIRRESRSTVVWSRPSPPWPHVSEAEVRYSRPLLTSFTPDVAGLQLLTDAHLDRAHDLTGWKTTKLAAGRHLVEARDLGAWYAEADPDPGLLEQARRDFGSMILTAEAIVDHNPWRDGVLDHMRWRFFEPRVELETPANARLLHR